MLVASLIVCLLYLTWVLALAELSVAMPFAGGPLAYGRRAVSPLLGFVMGWSMFLECLFAAISTALATGGYIAFLLNPENPDPLVKVVAAVLTVALFFGLHAWGVKEQSRAMVLMTYGTWPGWCCSGWWPPRTFHGSGFGRVATCCAAKAGKPSSTRCRTRFGGWS